MYPTAVLTLFLAAVAVALPQAPVCPPCSSPTTTTTVTATGTSTTATPTSTSPPQGSGVALHPNGNANKCMDVQGGVFANGTPVQIYDCNGTGAQRWVVNPGLTSVRIAGTNFCLDAGSTPGNNVGAKIWQCYDGLPAQQWWYTGDNRIALYNQGQCLDLTGGALANGNLLQTYQCTTGNTNQVWTK